MTKKEFKTRCNFQTYSGRNVRINAIYFDWKTGVTKEDKYFGGYKYVLHASNKIISKQKLFDLCYKVWENPKELFNLPDGIFYRAAASDINRFKIPLSI